MSGLYLKLSYSIINGNENKNKNDEDSEVEKELFALGGS